MSTDFNLTEAPAWLTNAQEGVKKYDTTKFLSIPKDGKVSVRILPPYKSDGVATKHVLHWGLTNDNGKMVPVKCSYHGPERYCPICEHVRTLEKELSLYVDKAGNMIGGSKERVETLKETIYSLKPKTGFYMNVVDNTDNQIKVMQVPKTAFEDLVEKMGEYYTQKNTEPFNLQSGVWFTFSRKGKGFSTEYSCDFKKILKKTTDGEDAEVRDTTPLSQELVDTITKQLNGGDGLMKDLGSLYQTRSAADLKSFLDGAPVTSGSRSSSRTGSLADKYTASTPAYSSAPEIDAEETIEESFDSQAAAIAVEAPVAAPTGLASQVAEMRRRAQQAKSQ